MNAPPASVISDSSERVSAPHSQRPVKLLVSVREAIEAELAIAGGVDLIDIKEPSRGSLGAVAPERVSRMLDSLTALTVPGSYFPGKTVPFSAALGELRDWQPAPIDPRLAFVKLGLAGCAERSDWQLAWATALQSVGPSTAKVAVAYADWRTAQAPQPCDVLQAGVRIGCRAVLVDTFDKSQGNLLAHWNLADLANFVAEVRQQGLTIVLAGSLDRDAIRTILPLAPDYLAVRGAACAGGRTSRLDATRIAQLVSLLRDADHAAAVSRGT